MDVSSLFDAPKNPIYFDSAASSLTAKPVRAKMEEFYSNYRANIHRGAHKYTKQASEEYEAVYGKLAKFFHAKETEFVQVRNTTEAINGVALGLDFHSGDEIIVSSIEHHSNLLPWLRLKEKGVKVKILQADEEGKLSSEKLESVLTPNTRLVALTACSNVLGTKEPIEQLVKVAKDNRSLVLLDAAQYVGHHPLDLSRVPADYIAFSGHKIFGPTGIGALYHREGAPLTPWFVGGGTIREASLEGYTLLENRERFEAGTPAVAEWIGLGAALDVIGKIGYNEIENHEKKLVAAMLQAFAANPKVLLYGPKAAADKACALFAFNVGKVPHHEVAVMLDKFGFACRSGHHCAMPLARRLGVEGSVRASLHVYNDEEQVRKFGEALGKISALA
ncbi:MAG: cysteine desulfurase [Candidatus Marsarchaeota archaeon]|nr:cysteine desulfurase [Candidatus Marsarchaeota archaeon]